MPTEQFRGRMDALQARNDQLRAQRAAEPRIQRNHRIGLGVLAVLWLVLTYVVPVLGIALAVFALIGWAGNRYYPRG
jgi:ABC-type Fe3+ transport system permease subunit